MRTAHKVALAATSALVLAILIALTAPLIVPILPSSVQGVVVGTLQTTPGTVDELFEQTGISSSGGGREVTHDEVDEEYVTAAKIWPWTLPPGWGFPKYRGEADVPGDHWNGMGVQAAFSHWAAASLKAVKSRDLDPEVADHLLDDVTDAYRVRYDKRLLSNSRFLDESILPLRSG